MTPTPFSEEDEAFVAENWGDMTAGQIADELDRTVKSIKSKAYRLRKEGRIE